MDFEHGIASVGLRTNGSDFANTGGYIDRQVHLPAIRLMAHAFAFAGDPSLYHYAFRFLILVGPLVVQGLAVSGTSPLDGEGRQIEQPFSSKCTSSPLLAILLKLPAGDNDERASSCSP
jgi:hypothetical protein